MKPMKKTILITMLILCLPLAYSIYGGETWKYHFDKCDELRINITAISTIDEGEYTILNNCTEIETNYYTCDCNNNYDFNVSFRINTVNNYIFHFNYDYSKEVTVSQKPSEGVPRRGSSGAFTARFEVGKPRTFMLKPNIISRFRINGNQHTIKITDIFNDSVRVEIKSEPQIIDLFLNEPRQIQIDNETLELTLTEIRGRVAFIEFEKLSSYVEIDEQIIEDEIIGNDTDEHGCMLMAGYTWNETRKECVREWSGEVQETEEAEGEVTVELPGEERKINIGLIIVVAITIIGLVAYFIIAVKKRAK